MAKIIVTVKGSNEVKIEKGEAAWLDVLRAVQGMIDYIHTDSSIARSYADRMIRNALERGK